MSLKDETLKTIDIEGTQLPPSSPEATTELAASLHKLKLKWNAHEHGTAEQSLFTNFMSPSAKHNTRELEEGSSPGLLASKAAALHVAALEKEIAEAKEREGSLREQLVQARAEIRRLKGLIENGSDESTIVKRGFCGAGLVDDTTTVTSNLLDFQVVKDNVRRLSQVWTLKLQPKFVHNTPFHSGSNEW